MADIEIKIHTSSNCHHCFCSLKSKAVGAHLGVCGVAAGVTITDSKINNKAFRIQMI